MDDAPTPRIETRVTLRVQGDIDAFSAGALEAAALDLGDLATTLVLDLRDVTLLDAAGVHTVHRVQLALEARDVELEVHNPTPTVLKVFTAAGLSDLLVIDLTATEGASTEGSRGPGDALRPRDQALRP